ncbi:MAG: phosphodiester glycosidase family protein, partial [Cyanobium sp.]
ANLAGIPGILKTSLALSSPRSAEPPLIVTALRVDLQAPGISLTGSGRAPLWSDNGSETISQTSRQFITAGRAAGLPLVAAINAAPFDLNDQKQFEAVPTNLRGFVVSEGQLLSGPDSNTDTFKSTFLLDAITGARIEDIWASNAPAASSLKVASSGFAMVLRDGLVQGDAITQNARSALGLSADRRHLVLVTVDRQQAGIVPGNWFGATDQDMGLILRGLGARNGLLLDGGTSSQLAAWNPSLAQAELLNAPQVERFVGSSLGVLYQPVGL